MKHNDRIVSLVFYFTLLCVSAKALRRSVLEQDDTGRDDVCADILGPNWNTTKQVESPCPELVVWVPRKRGFTEFVKINQHGEVEGGFSIAIFCYVLQSVPFNIRPIFKPFINDKGEMKGDYDQLLHHIEGQSCQAVAGDVTIRANRAQYVSFTIPYTSADFYMLVPASHDWNQTLWTFSRPFTPELWLTLMGACILTGVALAILEYRAGNHQFDVPLYRQLILVIWFPISTIFFHEGKIKNRCSKVVLVMWLSMIFLVLQIFTATLSSWLTLSQLHPNVPKNHEKTGYQNGSFIKNLLIEQYNCSGKSLRPLNSYEDFRDALNNGSVNGIIGQLPYIDLFLAKNANDEYMKYGPIFQFPGIAFAFARGSPLLHIFSEAVINVTESKVMMEMKKKYLGFTDPDKKRIKSPTPQSLGVKSFVGLFIFMGVVAITAIITSEIFLASINDKIYDEKEEEEEVE